MTAYFETLKKWGLSSGLSIVLIVLGAWIVKKVLDAAINRFEKHFEQKGAVPSEVEKRAKTLGGILHTTLIISIYVMAGIIILSELGIAVGPLLAGVGIASIAIGFGAQSLVKDVINGFFLLLEDQIRVGDVVNIAGMGGLVEAVNLRTTRLRDVEGRVHIIPNGLIEVATNFTKDWSRALLEIGVAYKEDIDQVIEVLKKVGEEMRAEPDYAPVILEPMTVLGVDSFGESSVNIRLFFKTVPLKQWEIAREYRRRLKKAFDAAGIEIPFPHRTVYIGEGKSMGKLKVDVAGHNLSKNAP